MRNLDFVAVSDDHTLTELKYVGTANLKGKLSFHCRRFTEQRKNIRKSFVFFRFRSHIIHTSLILQFCLCPTKSSSTNHAVSSYCDDLTEPEDYLRCFHKCRFDFTIEKLELNGICTQSLGVLSITHNRESLSIYGSTAFVDFARFFSFLIHTELVGLLWRWISPSQGRYLHTEQHKQRINAYRQSYLEWDWNPRSQFSSGRKRFMP
jgi:hypothetical protein